MPLRDYQVAAVESVFSEWKDNKSTLLCCPTGTGKTEIFSEIIRRIQPSRAMVICHRQELIYQAVKRIESMGVSASIEMADQVAGGSMWSDTAAVVSTVQTQCAGANGDGRMTHFQPEDFSVLIIDECHHCTSETYRRVIAHYAQNPNLKIVGVTATPDRADEAALGQVFESVAFDYEILDAIRDGWLVPIDQRFVQIEGLDYSHIRTTAGDLNGADLAAVMEAESNMQGVTGATIEIIGDRKTLIFTQSVRQAETIAEILNRHRTGMADWVHGGTPRADRHRKLRQFNDGSLQALANCAVLCEGYDEGGIEVVIQARATESRCLYAQQIGRGTRPLEGVVDGLDDADGRRTAIRLSEKPSLEVIDFVGNSGRHKLVSVADILGGKLDDDVIDEANRRARADGKPHRTDEDLAQIALEIEERKRREAARKVRLVAKATFSSVNVDPFSFFEVRPERPRGWDQGRVLSEPQRAVLLRQGIDPASISFRAAVRIIGEVSKRMKQKLCTYKQARFLLKRDIANAKGLSFADAHHMITDIANREGWRK